MEELDSIAHRTAARFEARRLAAAAANAESRSQAARAAYGSAHQGLAERIGESFERQRRDDSEEEKAA